MAKYYSVVTIDAITEMAWVQSYEASVSAIVDRHGGRYLARAAGEGVELLEGEREHPAAIVLVEWPSKEAAKAFYADPEYRPHQDARVAGTNGFSVLVEGT